MVDGRWLSGFFASRHLGRFSIKVTSQKENCYSSGRSAKVEELSGALNPQFLLEFNKVR
jgi:hypothetical protein